MSDHVASVACWYRVPGACRISAGWLECGIVCDAEIGGTGIMRHCRRYVIIGIYGSYFSVSTKMLISGQKAGFGSLNETGRKGHCMARFLGGSVLPIVAC